MNRDERHLCLVKAKKVLERLKDESLETLASLGEEGPVSGEILDEWNIINQARDYLYRNEKEFFGT
jgi:hypothetical protein